MNNLLSGEDHFIINPFLYMFVLMFDIILHLSGGTAFNGVIEELKKVTTRVSHVLPVSDDGGSTAEIVRVLGQGQITLTLVNLLKGLLNLSVLERISYNGHVLGGPAVGDIRSRCLRLSDENTSEALAVRRLLGHRLSLDPLQAKGEWYAFEPYIYVLLVLYNIKYKGSLYCCNVPKMGLA